MSVGHIHKRFNKLVHTYELKRLLTTGDAPSLMKRWNKLDLDQDIVDTCGYNVAGTTRYADRDFVHALYEPAYAEELLGKAIDTGLTPDQTLHCCLLHEAIEKVILDASNPIDDYEGAHEFATAGEHQKVRELGGTPVKYERGLAAIIKFCAAKTPKIVPKDYCCAPYLDDPDANDQRVLKIFRGLGVVDAEKLSKRSTNYGMASGLDRCGDCVHWQNSGAAALSTCALVEGLVRDNRGCDKFQGR
jgi:hypothetical protein